MHFISSSDYNNTCLLQEVTFKLKKKVENVYAAERHNDTFISFKMLSFYVYFFFFIKRMASIWL